MAGESVAAAEYGSDEFESSIASDGESKSSGEETASIVKGTKLKKSADRAARRSSPFADPLKRRAVVAENSTVQGQPCSSSVSIRQAVYDEWRRSKEKRLAEQQRKEAAERIALEKTEKEEKEHFKVKCEKAVEDWHARKKEQSVKSCKRELRDKDKMEAEKRERAERQGAVAEKALNEWRDKKDKILKVQHKERRAKEKEEYERKKAEEEEKHDAGKAAFDAWNTRKSDILRERHQKEQIAKKKKEQAKREAVIEKEESAKKAHEAWKSCKEGSMSLSSSSLNSSSSSLSLRPAWRPARSIQYDTPAQRKTGSDKHRPAKTQQRTASTPTVPHAASHVKVTEDGVVLKHKTIHVCCQTLQYWCSCPE